MTGREEIEYVLTNILERVLEVTLAQLSNERMQTSSEFHCFRDGRVYNKCVGTRK